MCARDTVDKNNMLKATDICNNHKDVLYYINSLGKKTSFTKKSYAYYTCKFLDYITANKGITFNNTENYSKILPMDIDMYMESIRYNEDGKEKSGTYRCANLAAIHGFFKFLKRNRYIQVDPCEEIETPKDNNIHEITTINSDDLSIIMENIKNGVGSKKAKSTQKKWQERDIALITLGMTTGLRVGAIVGLDVDDINFEEHTIVVTEKGDVQRKIYIGDKTIYALNNWLNARKKMEVVDSNALFIAQGGRRIATRTVQDLMKRLTNGTQKRITPHKMRATCATKLYEATGDIYLVQQQLGHKNIENTKRYTCVGEDKKIRSAQILDSLV